MAREYVELNELPTASSEDEDSESQTDASH
jgi:hypothetical protein